VGLIGGVGIVKTTRPAAGGIEVFAFTAPAGTVFTGGGCEDQSENHKVLNSGPSANGLTWTIQIHANGVPGTYNFWFSAVNTGLL